MKKVLSLTLALAMMVSALALASCGDDATDTTAAPKNTSAPVQSSDTTAAPTSDSGVTTTAPTEGGTETPPSSEEEESLDMKLYKALLELYRPFQDAEVTNADEFKADANNKDLMDEYFDKFNYDFSIYSGFDYTDSEDEEQIQFGRQDAPNLFDNDINTKWCVDAAESEFSNAVVWNMKQKVKVTGYSFTSGEDNATYIDRGPITWRIYGTNELPAAKMSDVNETYGDTYFNTYSVPEGWTLIDAVDAADPASDGLNSLIPDLNFNETIISLPEVCEFQYFMLMIDTNEANCIQISEVTLYGTPAEG